MHKSTTSKRKLPDTWLVVFFILVVIAILTWIVPSGSFDYETIDIDGTARKVAIAGSYHEISKSEVSATGLLGLFASLYEGCVSAADIIFVIMTCARDIRCHCQNRRFPRIYRSRGAKKR